MNNNLEFDNEDPSPDSIEDNHPRTNYGEGYIVKETLEEAAENYGNSIGNKNGTAQFDFIRGAKWQQEQILQFLYSEITERRPYSSSKMCEEVIKFIEQFKKNNMEKETLEEFINSQPYYGSCTTEYLEGIDEGAKWQQERM